MINVTKTYLPPIEEYAKYLDYIWGSNQVTNHGSLVLDLEKKLKTYLGVKHFFFVSNGTTALQIAIKALELKNEIITTPFSYVASTSSIVWENCLPVFVDIDPETLCINPNKIEEAITKKTTAILAVHVYGNPCETEKIQKIADKYNLKIIYDAAHAFGVKKDNISVLNNGDISTLSFHATKIFHTIEGGGLITNDDNLAHKISYMRNFGHNPPDKFFGLGINGKNCEFHAAMGLCILPKMKELDKKRERISKLYDSFLDSQIKRPKIKNDVTYNFSYYPIILPSERVLLRIMARLEKEKVFPRRYFYPSLNTLHYLKNKSEKMPISEDIASRVLCLPFYSDLHRRDVELISKLINSELELSTEGNK